MLTKKEMTNQVRRRTKMRVIRNYYSFKQIADALVEGTENTYKAAIKTAMGVMLGTQPSTAFEDVIQSLLLSHINDCVDWADWVPFFGEEPQEEPSEKVIEDFIRKLSSIYFKTKDRYETLLGLYSSEKSKLMDKVESISISRFNDSPQNGGDWSDDEHTSNITRNESSVDLTPVMDRLKTVQDNYLNLVKDWADKFKGLFFINPEEI